MITVRKMTKGDAPALYDMALRAFTPDYEKYGFYPPVLNLKKKRFLPPLLFGNVILADDEMVGAAFVATIGKNGEIGSIFIDPAHQKKGYGYEAMLAIEKRYPKIKNWKLDVLRENYGLHHFYESLGYVKTGEMRDPKSGLAGFAYIKHLQ